MKSANGNAIAAVEAATIKSNQTTSEATFSNDSKTNQELFTFSDLDFTPDLVCFSHLRWDFVFQRPQHLLTRFSDKIRVFFIEEPIFEDNITTGHMQLESRGDQLWKVVPYLPAGRSFAEVEAMLSELTTDLLQAHNIDNFIAWYYTPMALGFTSQLSPAVTVYDCMDELSAFAGAPRELLDREKELLNKADVVFTGGISLYEAKKDRHTNAHPFPSSIERAHFEKARQEQQDPADQASIPHPRMGFFGVIDERMNIDLVAAVADARPEWQIILIGPVVKIDPAILPKNKNIHYLGMKSYKELPSYLSGWDVAIMPFAMNESTKFISPTKTPEFLSAGKPVVSTSVRDVVRTYGEKGYVKIADEPEAFVLAVEEAMKQGKNEQWLQQVDEHLSLSSWDMTWAQMTHLICTQILNKDQQQVKA